ncbi:unnamed protein product [Pleuronectes platessa]|uniref:Uncharacterized protein n=1 Tax=Pleuronectes platessa TaxID=8262 RepID=A0A9N7VMK2_PLEPL|nr:unnamed protein product [Pleuronectes platessa]
MVWVLVSLETVPGTQDRLAPAAVKQRMGRIEKAEEEVEGTLERCRRGVKTAAWVHQSPDKCGRGDMSLKGHSEFSRDKEACRRGDAAPEMSNSAATHYTLHCLDWETEAMTGLR